MNKQNIAIFTDGGAHTGETARPVSNRGDGSEPVVAVHAECFGCGNTTVHTIPVSVLRWTHRRTFPDVCKHCAGEVHSHRIQAFLTGVNQRADHMVQWDRSRAQPVTDGGDGRGQ